MSRRTITVVLDGYGSLVSGYGTREMIQTIVGRAPCWSRARRGWVVQEHVARDLIAIAEVGHRDLVITGASGRPGAGTAPGPIDQVRSAAHLPQTPEPEGLF